MASNFYQGFKSKRLNKKLNKPFGKHHISQTFGVTSLPSDSMSKIMTH